MADASPHLHCATMRAPPRSPCPIRRSPPSIRAGAFPRQKRMPPPGPLRPRLRTRMSASRLTAEPRSVPQLRPSPVSSCWSRSSLGLAPSCEADRWLWLRCPATALPRRRWNSLEPARHLPLAPLAPLDWAPSCRRPCATTDSTAKSCASTSAPRPATTSYRAKSVAWPAVGSLAVPQAQAPGWSLPGATRPSTARTSRAVRPKARATPAGAAEHHLRPLVWRGKPPPDAGRTSRHAHLWRHPTWRPA